MYYNTTNLTQDQLREAQSLASRQDTQVFNLFYEHSDLEYTSHEVEDILQVYPRSSIVRSINTLTNMDLLEKTNNQVIGKYGKLVYTWKLKQKHDQLSLL